MCSKARYPIDWRFGRKMPWSQGCTPEFYALPVDGIPSQTSKTDSEIITQVFQEGHHSHVSCLFPLIIPLFIPFLALKTFEIFLKEGY